MVRLLSPFPPNRVVVPIVTAALIVPLDVEVHALDIVLIADREVISEFAPDVAFVFMEVVIVEKSMLPVKEVAAIGPAFDMLAPCQLKVSAPADDASIKMNSSLIKGSRWG